jgi:hypothetical protein
MSTPGARAVLPDGLVLAGPVHERGCLVSFTRGFAGEAAQVSRARAAVTLLLDGCPAAADAVLIASELAANAVVHTRSAAPGGQFTVRAGACPGRHVWVAVQDAGGPWAGRDDDGRPHGLELTAALARDWGVGGDADHGRTVWAVLAWAAGDAVPAPCREGRVPLCRCLPRGA